MPKKPNPPRPPHRRDKDPTSNKEKVFKIRVYANTGSYSGDYDLIDEFTRQFKSIVTERGEVIADNEKQLQDFIIDIGQNGYLREEPTGYVFFPPHRIHYVEAIDLEV